MSERNVVGWFEIYVDDMERAKKFYEAVFDKELEKLGIDPTMELWAFPGEPSRAGCHGALVKMAGVKAGGGSTLVYFTSEDCGIEEKRVAENGGQVHKPKFSIGEYGFITLCVDTEGNMFGIHSLR